MPETNSTTKESLKKTNIEPSVLIAWFAAIGLEGEHDLDKGTTTWIFDDNSKIIISGAGVEIS